MDKPSSSQAAIYPINFPSDVLKWMKINAKPQMSLKLMQICKFFQHKKFPYTVIRGISNRNGGTWNYQTFGDGRHGEIESLDTYPDGSLWITGFIYLYTKTDLLITLLPKIAVCEASVLSLYSQTLTFDDFKKLTACGICTKINLAKSIITDIDDELIALESILKCLPKIKYMYFEDNIPSIISPEVAANLAPNLLIFDAYGVTEEFNFANFIPFITAHPSVIYQIIYDFCCTLSPMYKHQIQEFINQIIKENSIKYPPPMIDFPGRKAKNAMDELKQRYDNRRRD